MPGPSKNMGAAAPEAESIRLPAPLDDAPAWLAFALGFAAMALAGAPGPSWLDSGELIAAARELGQIHPPGHPAWLSLAGLADVLPMGPHAARVVWLSALAGGAALFALVRLARRVLAATDTGPLAGVWAGLGALTLAASGSLWQVAVRAEVYTLALATSLWALEAALRAGEAAAGNRLSGQAPAPRGPIPPTAPRSVIAPLGEVAVALAVGLANHHYVTLFTVPALVVAAWPALAWVTSHKPRWWLGFVGIGACVGLVYLALPLRAAADIEMRWGDPRSFTGFWDTVTARHFQRSVTEASVPIGDHALVLLGMVAEAMGPALAALGAAGLAWSLARARRVQVALWLALGLGILTKAIMQIDTRNPDDHGYILMAPAMLAVGTAQFASLAWAGLARLQRPRLRVGLALAGLAAVAGLAGWQLVAVGRRAETNLADLRAPDAVDAHLRASLAPGALYLANYFGLGFNEQAFRVAEGRRPDLVVAHVSFRTGDTDGGRAWQNWFARRHPELRSLAVAAAALGRAPVGNVLALVETQPVYAEQDPDLRIPPPYFGFDGLAQRLLPATERAIDYEITDIRERHERIWQTLYTRLGAQALADHPTRAVLLWQHALQAAHALRRGWISVAQAELDRARSLNATDRLLAQLDRRLGALDAAWKRSDTKAFQATWHRYSTLDFDALATPDPAPGEARETR